MKHLIYLSVLFFLFSCSDKKKVKTYYENGALKEEFKVSKKDTSLIQGNFKRYFNQGQLQEEANYTNGLLDGKRMLYYDNGVLMVEENHASGEYHGIYTSYYPSGNIESKGSYVNSIMEGKWDFFL